MGDPSRSHGPDEGDEGDEGHEGDEGDPERRRDRCQDCGEDGAEAEGREGGLQRAERDRPVGGKKNEKFTIPQLVVLKLKHKPARKAGMKVMFGKEVRVAAKPASKVVKAFPAKALKASIWALHPD